MPPPALQLPEQAMTKKTPSMANLLLPLSKTDRRSSSAGSTKHKTMRLSTLNLDISPNNKSKRGSTIPMPGSTAGSRRPSKAPENGSRRPSKVVPRLTAESSISVPPSAPMTPTEEDRSAPPADELEQAIMAIALGAEAGTFGEVGGQPSSKVRRERPSQMPLTREELQELQRVVDEHWLVRGERYFRLLDFSREMHEDRWEELQKMVHGYRLRVAGLIDGWTPRAGTKQGLLRMYTVSELQEEQEKLRHSLSFLTVSNTWFLHKSLRKARWVTMAKYRSAKSALTEAYQEKLEEWRSDAKTNQFKNWMSSEADKQDEESDETAFDIGANSGLASAAGSFTAGSFTKEDRKGKTSASRSSNRPIASSKSTMYWLLVSGERALDEEHRALPIRCRDLLKQLQQHGHLLKQQLRNAQKAGFLDELIGALTNVTQEARKEVEDIHQQLASLVESIHKDQLMLDQHRALEGAELKSMESKQQRLEMTLKTCLTAINSESHWLGTLRADTQGGCVDNLRKAREKLIELDQKRPFPMLIHCRLAGSTKHGSIDDSRLSGPSPAPSLAVAGLRKALEGLDARLVITALQEPVMAAKSMSRSIQQWQQLAGKRVNQVTKVMAERKTYIAGRSRAQEARRKQVAKELATDKSAEKNFILNRWAAFKRLHVKYATDHIVPEDKALWKEQTKQAELRAELEAVQDEAAKLKERLGNEQRQYIRTQTSIHRHPQMMVKSAALQKQFEGVLQKNAEVKTRLQLTENDVNHADKCSCVLMSDAISLVRLLSDIDNHGAKQLIASNPCLKIIKRDVDERPEKPSEAKVNATLQKLAKAVKKIDSHSLDNPGDPDDAESSSSSDPSENEETDTVAPMEKKSVVSSRRSRRRTTTGAALSKLRSMSIMSRRHRAGNIVPTPSSPELHANKATRKARATVIDQQQVMGNSGSEAQSPNAQDILNECAQLHKASVYGVERMKRFSSNPSPGIGEEGSSKPRKDPARFQTVHTIEEQDEKVEKAGRNRRSMSRRESQPANVMSREMQDKQDAERDKAEEAMARRKAAQAARLLWKEEVAARKAKNRFAVVSDKIRKALPPDLAKVAQKMLEEEAEDPCGVKRLEKEQKDLSSEQKTADEGLQKLGERFLIMKVQCLKEIAMLEAMSENEEEDANGPAVEQPQGLLADIADEIIDEQDMPPALSDAEGTSASGTEEAEADAKRDKSKRKALNRQNSRGRKASWVFRANRLWNKAKKAVIKERPEGEEGLPASQNESANKAWDELLPGLISSARRSEPPAAQADDESFLGKELKKEMTRSEELAKSRWEFQKRAIKAAIAAQSERRRIAKEKAREREDAIASAMSISNDMERQNALNPLLEYTPTWDEALQMQLTPDQDGPLKKNRGQSILHVFKQRGVFRMFRSSFGKSSKEAEPEPEKERRSLRAHVKDIRDIKAEKKLQKQKSNKAAEMQWSDLLASLDEDRPLAENAEEGDAGGSESKANASKQTPNQLSSTEEEPSAITASSAAAESGHPGKVSMRCIASKGVAYCKSPDFSAFHEQTISVGSTVLVPEDQAGEAWVEVDGLWLPMKDASGKPNFETVQGTQGTKVRSSLASKAQKKSPRASHRARLQAKFDLMGAEGKADSKKGIMKKTPSFVRQQSPAEVDDEAQSSDTSSEGSTDHIEADEAHHLTVGDLVVAKFPPNKSKDDNPWLAGRVARIDTATMRCSIEYENGETHASVKEDEVMFAPSRDDKWGTGQSRGSDAVPEDAKEVKIKPRRKHHLSIGDLVVAKFPPNKHRDANPWLAGKVTHIDTETMRCCVQYENGESHADVQEDEVMFAPSLDDKWSTGQSRGSDVVPDDAKEVKIKPRRKHHLSIGDLVVAKFPPNKHRDANPWLAGRVTRIDPDTMRCSVEYENGESHADVKEDEVMFAPSRDDKWGTGQSVSSDLVPDDAKPVKIKAPARHRLAIGDLVVAKSPLNRDKDVNPWLAGKVTYIDMNTMGCSIHYENGETHASVREHEVLFAPARDDQWGISHSHGHDVVPENAKQVKIKVSKSAVGGSTPLASPVPHPPSVSLQPTRVLLEPSGVQHLQKRQLGRRNGLNLFFHEFMCKDGKVLGRRTDFVSKAQVPQIWKLREESKVPVLKHGSLGSEFHLRWYPALAPEVPISRYNEGSYCKVVKLLLVQSCPGKVHLEYEAFGDMVMQDPLMSRIIWQGGTAAACKSISLPSNDVILEDEQSSTKGCLIFEGVNTDKCCMFKFGSFGYSEVAISFPLSVPMPPDPICPYPKPEPTGEKLLRMKLLRGLLSQREKHVQELHSSPSNLRRQSTSKLGELLRVRPALRKEYVGQMLQRITVRGILRRRTQLLADANSMLGTEGTDQPGALSVAFAIDGDSTNQPATTTEEGGDKLSDPSRAPSILSQGSGSRKNTRTLSLALPAGADDAEVERRHSRRMSENRSSLAARSRQASNSDKVEKSESQKSLLQTPAEKQNRERSLTFTLWIADEEDQDGTKQKSEGRSSSKASARRQSRASTSAAAADNTPPPEAGSQTPPRRTASKSSASKSSQSTPPGRTASQSSQPTPPRSRNQSRVSRAESIASRAESRILDGLEERSLRSTSRDLGRSRSRLMSRASSVSLADQSLDEYDHQCFDSQGLPLEKQTSPMHVFTPSQGQDAPRGQTPEAEPRKMVRRLLQERSSDQVVPLPSLRVCKRRSRKSRADSASRAGSPDLNEAAQAAPDLPAPSPVRASLATRARPEDTTMGRARIAGNKLLALSALHSELGANSNEFYLDEKANFFKEAIELHEAAATLQEERPVQADRSRLTVKATEAYAPPAIHTPRRDAILLREGHEERMDLEALIKVMQSEGHFAQQVSSSASSSAGDSTFNGIESVCASIEAVPTLLSEEEPAANDRETSDDKLPETMENVPEPVEKTPQSREESPESSEKLPEPRKSSPETRKNLPESTSGVQYHYQTMVPERQTTSFYGSERRIGSVFRPEHQFSRQMTKDSRLDSSGLHCGSENPPEDQICRYQGGKTPDFKTCSQVLRLYSRTKKRRKPQSQDTDLSLVGRRSLPLPGEAGQHRGTMDARAKKALVIQSISRPSKAKSKPQPAAEQACESTSDFEQESRRSLAPPEDEPDDWLMPRAGSPQEKAIKTRRQAMVLNLAGGTVEEEMPAVPRLSEVEAWESMAPAEEGQQPSNVDPARNAAMAAAILNDMTGIVTDMVTAAEPTSKRAHSDGAGETKSVKEVPLRCVPASQHKPSPKPMSAKVRADLGLSLISLSPSPSQQALTQTQDLPNPPRTLAGSSSKKFLISSASAMVAAHSGLNLGLKPLPSVSSESTEVTALPSNHEVFLQSSLESSTMSSGVAKLSDHAVHNVSLVEAEPELSEADGFSAINSSADDADADHFDLPDAHIAGVRKHRSSSQQYPADTPSSEQGLHEELGHAEAAAASPALSSSSSIHLGSSPASSQLDMSPPAPSEHLDGPPAAAPTSHAVLEASNSVVMSTATDTAVLQEGSVNMSIDQKVDAPRISDSDKMPPGLAEILDSIDAADLVGLADNYQQAWCWESLGPMFDPATQHPKASQLERVRQGSPTLSLLSGDCPLFNDNIGTQSERRPLGGHIRNDLKPKPRRELMPDETKLRLERIQYPRSLCIDAREGNTAATPLPLPEIEIEELVRAPPSTQHRITPMPFRGKRSCTGAPQRSPRASRDAQNAVSKACEIPDRSPQAVGGLPTMSATKVKSVAASMLKGCKPPLQPNRHRDGPSPSPSPMWEERSTRTPSPEAEIPLPALQSRGGTTTVSPPWLLSGDPSPSPDCHEILRPGTAPGLPLAAGRRLPTARPESSMNVRREVAAAGREAVGPRPESSFDVRRESGSGAQGSRSGAQTSMGSRPGESDTGLHWQTGNVSWRQAVGSKAKLSQQRLRIDSLLRR